MSLESWERSQQFWGPVKSEPLYDIAGARAENERILKKYYGPNWREVIEAKLKHERLHSRINDHAFLKSRGRDPLERLKEKLGRI